MTLSNSGIIKNIKGYLGNDWAEKLTSDPLNFKRATVYYWAQKDKLPKLADIIKIAKFLDISLDFLVTGKEKETDLTRAEKNLVAKWQCLDAQGQREVIALIDAKLRVYEENEQVSDTSPLGKAAGNP